MECTIHDANLDDIPQLVSLLNALFSIEVDFNPNTAQQIKGLQLLLAEPSRGVIKVARNASDVAVGMVSAQLVISTAQGAPSAWIEDMVIRQEYRQSGIGRRLLDAALAWAKAQGASRAQLLVDVTNDSALGYYRHLGWEDTSLQARRLFL
ncbi:MAG: GNAT family N-acetyltransferase [Methylophilaceae bacterium]